MDSFFRSIDEQFYFNRASSDIPSSMKAMHYHNKYELYYLFSGERYYFIKDRTYRVRSGSFVLIDKNEIHRTGAVGNAGYDRTVISFDESCFDFLSDTAECERLLAPFRQGGGVLTLTGESKALAQMLLTGMEREWKEKGGERTLFLTTALVQLLLLILRENADLQAARVDITSTPHPTVSKIIAYINTHYAEEITLETLSKRFCISPCYLSRTFKKASGLSFPRYLNNVRVKEAKRLLKKTKMPIGAVCEAVGYASNAHFGRAFKSLTGRSPQEYRRGQGKRENTPIDQ